MQSKGTITGLTSAATIWAVAAIGLSIGAGFYVEGLGTTAMVMIVLLVIGNLEHKLVRTSRTLPMTVRAAVNADFTPLQQLLHDEGIKVIERSSYDHPRDRVFELRLRGPATQFEVARDALLERADVLRRHDPLGGAGPASCARTTVAREPLAAGSALWQLRQVVRAPCIRGVSPRRSWDRLEAHSS